MVRNFSLKDKTTALLRSSLVYIFRCLDDPRVAYIGKTRRYLNKRAGEHKKGGSAVSGHVQSCERCRTSDNFVHNLFKMLEKAKSRSRGPINGCCQQLPATNFCSHGHN